MGLSVFTLVQQMRHTSLMHASKIATCVIVLAVSALVAGERHRMTEERSKELFEEAIRAAAAAQGSKLQVIVQPHSHDDGMVVIPCVFGFFLGWRACLVCACASPCCARLTSKCLWHVAFLLSREQSAGFARLTRFVC